MTNATVGLAGPLISRTLMGLGVWLCLSRGDLAGFVGPVAAIAAALVSLRMWPPAHRLLLPHRLLLFLLQFVRDSLFAGLDVARRSASRHPDLAPDLIELRLGLASEGERVLLAHIVTLLPGTLAADLDGQRLTVHALDRRRDVARQVRGLEDGIRSLRRPRSEDP